MAAPADLIRKIRRIEITTRRAVQDTLAGGYHSVFKGRGMAFSEVRPYQPGDEIRAIDWNVTARLGSAYVKRYLEERELTVLFLVDVSASGRFGTRVRTKQALAVEVCAVLALAAARNHDRVGAVWVTDRVERFVPPRRGREHALRVLRELLAFETAGRGTDIRRALEVLRRVVTKRAVLFLVSDFEDRGYERTLRALARKHDVVAISVSDPREAALPEVGLVAAEDPETGAVVVLDTGSGWVREAYSARASSRRQATAAALQGAGVDLLDLSTGEPYDLPLVRFFRERARRVARGGG